MITMTDGEQFMAVARQLRLDPYCSQVPRFLGLPDANALLSSIDNDCRNGWRSRLLRMTDRETAFLYAANHVYWEIYEHLPRVAQWSKVPVVVLRSRFETEYLPVLRFVTVDASEIVDPQVLAITDPDDVPTGQLAKLIAPCIVFSEDRHLRLPGLAPADWRAVAQFAVDVVEGATGQRVTANAATLPLQGGVELIKFLGRRTGLSPWLIGGIVAGGAVLLLKDPERRKTVSKYVIPVLEAYGKQFERAMVQEQRGLAGLGEVILPSPAVPTSKQQVAIVMARQREPLLAKEIQAKILGHFPGELVPTITEVRTVLDDGPEFIQPERYRWQFGRLAGPWQGRY